MVNEYEAIRSRRVPDAIAHAGVVLVRGGTEAPLVEEFQTAAHDPLDLGAGAEVNGDVEVTLLLRGRG